MIELNVYSVVLLPLVGLISYAIWLRLRMPVEYRQISSHVPSVTKNFWSEMLLSTKLAMMQPKDILPFLTDMIRNNGPVVHFNLSGRSYVFLNDPDDLKILLSNTQNIKKGPEYKMLKPWLNEGLLLSSGQKWHSRRKLLTNTFHFKTLGMYNPSINKHSRILVDKLLDASAKGDEKISIADYVTLCSLDIICETIMGTEMNSQEGESVQYVHSIKCACRSVIERIFKFWLWNGLVYKMSGSGQRFFKSIKVLHEFTDNVIKSKRASLNTSEIEKVQPDSKLEKTQKKSFLDLLLSVLNNTQEQMNDRDIREEVDTFLFEGHDTSSISMTMTLVLLGIYPDIQDQARDEVRSIFGDSDRDATMEDLNAMKYLEAVIKESLRLYPSVPGITRELQTPLQLKNYIIPPMTTIAVYPFILHRNEDIYPNAEEFIPERFLDEENKAKFQFGYLPFSAGARNCIGQKYAMNQMKIVVSTILRNAKFESLGRKEDIQISTQLVLRIESLPKMKFFKL
ncbi:cytochrome P450 4C1-like [Myzus persicae]|uniref:cytochrome P450 4C1-like n=1 Tax=Myzus persicae TaxID=13164 RepID=UPI000B937F8A|nr:cytochrome P450 4C1-like [Myzus persicae]XP_022170398.1 cytochrome P450 4C1-like [Myzus persicae]